MNALRLLLTVLAGLGFLYGAQAQSTGRDMQITVYNDGRSCPADCDAHVVFRNIHNGTGNAHLPGPGLAPCVVGKECQICFDANLSQCMTVMYRGNGPAVGRFDFTPSFFEAACARSDLPAMLAADCAAKAKAAKAWENRLNCIKDPALPKCLDLMAKAAQAKEADEIKYRKCKEMGETSYNAGQPAAEKRANDCTYEKTPTGGNTPGEWAKLLPAACGPATYVGPYGTDCCTGRPLTDAPLGVECRAFYPLK